MVARMGVDQRTVKFITRAMAVLGGMASIVIVLLIQLLTLLKVGADVLSMYLFFSIVPAVTEEPLKQLGLAVLAVKQPGWISSRSDGAIAGALAGLSFGIFEGLFYIMGGAGVSRILPIFMHTGASALGGVGIYHGCKREYGRMLAWIGAAIGVHLAWNSVALLITLL